MTLSIGQSDGSDLLDPPALNFVRTPLFARLNPKLLPGHEVQLLDSGEEFFPALEAAIQTASTCIFLETYIFQNDHTGIRIARALADAALRGVKVHVLVDGFGTTNYDGEWIQLLRNAQVSPAVFRPENGRRYDLNRKRLRRLHRKLTVIDGKIAFVGGINILDDHNSSNGRLKLDHPRRDYAVRVMGPLVAQAHATAARLWWEVSFVNQCRIRQGKSGPYIPFRFPAAVLSDITCAGTTCAALLLRDNLRHRATIEQHYLEAIHQAKREILIACAYFLPGIGFRRALKDAAARGVRVRLLLQGKIEYPLQHYAAQAMYGELLKAGIEIFAYQLSFLHAKAAAIDDWATVGSSNIDPFSFFLAREANVVIQDRAFAKQLRSRIQSAIENGSTAVDSQKYTASQTWLSRIRNRAAYILLRFAIAFIPSHDRY